MDDRRQLDRWLARNPMPPRTKENTEARREYFAAMPEALKRVWHVQQARIDCEAPDHNAAMAERAAKRMARVDAMGPELRKVVYEYGLELVQEFLNCGVKIPSRIAHLIDTVRHEDFPNGQPRFKINKAPQAKQNPISQDDDYYYVPRAQRS